MEKYTNPFPEEESGTSVKGLPLNISSTTATVQEFPAKCCICPPLGIYTDISTFLYIYINIDTNLDR